MNTLLCPTQTLAGNCTDGTEYVGKNGHTYCVSNVTMNWWSAFNWCVSQGRHLASMDEVCNISETEYWLGGVGAKACPNTIGGSINRYAWTSLGSGTSYAYVVHLSSGAVNDAGGNPSTRNNPYYVVICW